MFRKTHTRRVLAKCYLQLAIAYGDADTFSKQQVLRVVTDLRVQRSYQPFVFALFLKEVDYKSFSELDYRTVRRNIRVNFFGVDPAIATSDAINFKQLFGFDGLDTASHTKIGINHNAFWGSGLP